MLFLTAAVDGSLCEVIPIEDEVYKRLQLLQGQLSRNVQQVAGLNPKAFRYEAKWFGVWLVTDIYFVGRYRMSLLHGRCSRGSWMGLCWRCLKCSRWDGRQR